jgi:hypothetical protein
MRWWAELERRLGLPVAPWIGSQPAVLQQHQPPPPPPPPPEQAAPAQAPPSQQANAQPAAAKETRDPQPPEREQHAQPPRRQDDVRRQTTEAPSPSPREVSRRDHADRDATPNVAPKPYASLALVPMLLSPRAILRGRGRRRGRTNREAEDVK